MVPVPGARRPIHGVEDVHLRGIAEDRGWTVDPEQQAPLGHPAAVLPPFGRKLRKIQPLRRLAPYGRPPHGSDPEAPGDAIEHARVDGPLQDSYPLGEMVVFPVLDSEAASAIASSSNRAACAAP